VLDQRPKRNKLFDRVSVAIRLCVLVLACSLAAVSVQAQPWAGQRPLIALIKVWNSTLEAADRSLGKSELTDERLEEIRAEVGRLRLEATAAVEAAGPEAQAIRDELQALGPPPGEGQPPEAASLAAKRKAIGEILAVTEGAIKETELIVTRADRILGQSAALRRVRLTERLLARGPSPLTRAVWEKAGSEFLDSVIHVRDAFLSWTTSPTFAEQAPLLGGRLLFALAAALLPVWPLRRWILRRFGYVSVEAEPSHRQRLWTALVTGLVRSLLPSAAVLAIYLVLQGADLIVEPWAGVARRALLAMIFFFFVQAFAGAALAPFQSAWRIVDLSDAAARVVNRIVTALALLFALDWIASELSAQFGASIEQTLIQKFVSGLLIAGLLLALLRERVWQGPGIALKQRVWRRARWLLRLLVLAIPGTALLGYVVLSRVLATQLVLTPAVCLAIVLLRRVGAETVRHALSRQSSFGLQLRQGLSLTDEGSEMLGFWVTETVGVIILLFGMIVLAILWGAGRDDLANWTYSVLLGFKIGNITLSLADILWAALSFALLLTATRLFQRMLEHRLFPRTRLDLGLRNSIRAAVGYLGFLLAITVAVSIIGLDLDNLAIIAGALSVGIGFGLQNIVNNFVSGLILLVERPIKTGDWVAVGEHQGHVRKISVRATEITTFDKASVFIPNSSLIASPVMNRTYANKVGRIILPVGLAYGTDIGRVRDLLMDIAEAHPDVARTPAPAVLFGQFGDSAIQLEVVAFLHDVDKVKAVTSDLGFEIDATFRREGIVIPFPQREVHIGLRDDQLARLLETIERARERLAPR